MNFKTLIFLVFLGLSGALSAQSKYIKEANRMFRNENYCEAADKCALAYTKIARKGKSALNTKGDMAFKTAECYRQTEDYKNATEWYDKAILLKYYTVEPRVYLYNGDEFRLMGEYKKAVENYKEYKKLVPGDERGDIGIKAVADIEEYKENRTRHVVTNISPLNMEGTDMSPMFVDKKAVKMAFSSSRKGGVTAELDPRTCEPYMDIWVSEIDKKGNWQQPKLIDGEGVNTDDNEGTVCIDARGKIMFFTRCPNVKKMNLGCEIWMSDAKGQGWDSPVELTALKSNDTVSIGHPCVSDDGKYLVFVSDFTGEGSQGGKDLWYSEFNKKTKEWGAPKNLGPVINTKGDEYFPTFAENGDLFYSSTGLEGMGGLDIFRAAKVADKIQWENPTNMQSPINSNFNDFGLIESGNRKGYFTSDRKGVKGEKLKPDLWMYEIPAPLFSLKVIGIDIETKERIPGALVTVKGQDPDKWDGLTQGKEGSVYWDKRPNGDRFVKENTTYKVFIEKEGYHINKKPIELTTVGLEYNQDFVLEMYMLPKTPIRLPEVRYPLGSWDLLVNESINSKDSLLYVFNLLTEYPEMVLELSSHTDARGSDKSNQVLSENRAKACYKFLVQEKGIDPRRIIPVGKGEREPAKWLDPATGEKVLLTEAYINQFKKTDVAKFEMLHQLNRRTEGRVLSLDFDPATAAPANPEYLQFRVVPKK